MKFESPIIMGTLLKRYKRFLADIRLSDGTEVVAHIPNTGPMTSCIGENWPCAITHNPSPTRKLAYTLEMTLDGKTFIGVNTQRPNKLVEEAFLKRKMPQLLEFDQYEKEKKVGHQRPDFYFYHSQSQKDLFIEVKNVTLKKNNRCYFPDAVSTRATAHLELLLELKKKGHGAGLIFVVQREDVDSFSPAYFIDLHYANLLKKCFHAGVIILVYRCHLNENEIVIDKEIPLSWEGF